MVRAKHHIAQPGDLNRWQRPCQLLGDDVPTEKKTVDATISPIPRSGT
jgi:hypothetical protein